MTDQQASSKPSILSPNIQQFMDKALPPKTGGHALAIGENHDLVSHVHFLHGAAKQLSDPNGNNVGTIGVEHSTYKNVLFWAARDGSLPVAKEKEAQYFERMMTEGVDLRFITNVRQTAKLLYDFLKQQPENQVVAFDARTKLDDKLTRSRINAIAALGLDDNLNQRLRNDEVYFQSWAILLLNDPNFRSKLEAEGFRPNLPVIKNLWSMGEIASIIKKHPEYAERLKKLESLDIQKPDTVSLDSQKLTADGVSPELYFDMRSARILAANLNTEKNTITISGLSHTSGIREQDKQVEGTFAGHLAYLGLKVTPAIILNTPDLRRTLYQRPTNCAAQAPMNLIIWDKDVAVDVSNRETIVQTTKQANADTNAVQAASALVPAGTKLTCNAPELPTIAECVMREVQNKGSCEPPRWLIKF
jgi:hypothetical protein